MHIYYLIQFLSVRNLGAAWLGGSGSGSVMRLWSSYQPGHSHLKARGSLFKFTYVVVPQTWMEGSDICHVNLSMGMSEYTQEMTAGIC